MAFGNIAFRLLDSGVHGRLVIVRNGIYDSAPIDVVTGTKKVVDVPKYYNVERLRPLYQTFTNMPLFIMTSDW
jgi:6-phosphofructokinase 1